jgi:hypothetical protein
MSVLMAWAAEHIIPHQAQLSGALGTDTGTLVTVGDQLVFIDNVNPNNSFAISRSEISNLNLQNGVMSIGLNRPFNLPVGAGSQMVVRFNNANSPAVIANWVGIPITNATIVQADRNATTTTTTTTTGVLPAAAEYNFNVKHDDDTGRLIVGPNALNYTSLTKPEKSRTWSYAEIKEFKRDKDDNTLRVQPYHGDSYKFKLTDGAGMADTVYNMIADRIVAARRGR